MKKLIFAAVAFVVLAMGKLSAQVAAPNGWYYTHASSSGSIFTGAGEVGAIYMSSGPAATVEWGVGIDTSATTAVPASVLNNASLRATPALVFNSTITLQLSNTAASFTYDRMWVPSGDGNGIRVKNGFYWLPSAVASGEALRAIIKWRRERTDY